MEPTELRIGNWIYNGIGEDFTVNAMTIGHFYEGQILGQFKPIEINEEWLSRFGFKKEDKRLVLYFRSESDFHLNTQIEIDFHDGFIGLNSNENWTDNLYHIKYVHQLQNLYFALCGKELTS